MVHFWYRASPVVVSLVAHAGKTCEEEKRYVERKETGYEYKDRVILIEEKQISKEYEWNELENSCKA